MNREDRYSKWLTDAEHMLLKLIEQNNKLRRYTHHEENCGLLQQVWWMSHRACTCGLEPLKRDIAF